MKKPWYAPKKLCSMMTKYQELHAKFKESRSKKVEYELFILKTDIINLLFELG